MCVNPRLLTGSDGLSVEVACRKCWQCIENRQNDWVGRCIAESRSAAAVTVVHLTYGGDDKVTGLKTDLGASILIYSDVRLWLARLRRGHVDPSTGLRVAYPLRFFAVGEYGELKGRSHWHVICFWEKQSPPFIEGKRDFDDEFWRRVDDQGRSVPIGFTMTESLRGADDVGMERAIRYVCKYLQKSDSKQTVVRMSKKPPLGAHYFRQRAESYAEQGLLPIDAFYSFPGLVKDGAPRKFKLAGASLDYFMSSFVQAWERRYGEHPLDVRHSDFLLAWCDSQAARLSVEQLERRQVGAKPSITVPEHYGAYYLWETRNVYVTDPVDAFRCLPRLFWSFDKEGYPAWSKEIVTAAEADGIRRAKIASRDSDAYRTASGL